jgi:spore coat polysaccharide biosynthesis protein SpsF
VEVIRGSLVDVLDRFWEGATRFDLDIIVRHTADNIFIDLDRVSKAIAIAKMLSPDSIFLISSRKQLVPIGMDIEIFSKGALDLAKESATSPYDREHVTSYLYESSQVELVQFKVDLSKEFKTSIPSCTIDLFTDIGVAEEYARWLGNKLPTFENCYEWWGRR